MPDSWIDEMQSSRSRSYGWKPKAGSNLIRVLPPTMLYFTEHERFVEEVHDFVYEANVHFIRVEGEDPLVGRCPRDNKSGKQHCIACEMAQRFNNDEADPILAKHARQIRRGGQFLMNMVDMNNPTLGVQHYAAGWKVYTGIREIIGNAAWGDPLHPQTGYGFYITMTPGNQSKTGYNDYTVQPDPNRVDIMQYVGETWQQEVDALAGELPPYLEAEDMEKALKRLGFPVGEPVSMPSAGIPLPSHGPPPMPPSAPPAPPSAGVPPVPPPSTGAPTPPPVPPPPTTGTPPPPPAAPTAAAAPAPASMAAQPPCFGQYDPEVHPCDSGEYGTPCFVRGKCQVLNLGVGGA